MNKKSIQIIQYVIQKIISLVLIGNGIFAIISGIETTSLSIGSFCSYKTYGGDAYTGIQNAIAIANQTARDGNRINRYALGSLLIVIGITLCCIGVYSLFIRIQTNKSEKTNNTPTLNVQYSKNQVEQDKETSVNTETEISAVAPTKLNGVLQK